MGFGNFLSVLLLPAHALTLALLRVPRGTWLRWLTAASAAMVPIVPLLWVALGERGAVGIASYAGPAAVADFALADGTAEPVDIADLAPQPGDLRLTTGAHAI